MKYEDLKILDELREKGSITEEEYQREKAKILNRGDNVFSQAGQKPLFGMAENTYLMLMHLSIFAGVVMPLFGFIVPILLWFVNKDNNANVDLHGKNIINFIISYSIYMAVAALSIILVIGIMLLPIMGAVSIIVVILAAIKANNGTYWKYPLVIEFLK